MTTVPFREVLELLKPHGWELYAEGEGSWRVFRKRVPQNEEEPLPFVIQVENKRVSIEYVEQAKRLVGEA